MKGNKLQQISKLFTQNSTLQASPNKSLGIKTNKFHGLNDDLFKAKLQTCLYSLKQFKTNIDKNTFNLIKQKENQNMQQQIISNKKLQKLQLPLLKNQYKLLKLLKNTMRTSSLFQNDNNQKLNQYLKLKKQKQQNSLLINLNKSSKSILDDFVKDKSTQKINHYDTNLKSKQIKKINVRPKVSKHLYQSAQGKALTIQNRFFPNKLTPIDEKQIRKLGLYQSNNRFRKEQINQQNKELSPKIQKKGFSIAKKCKQNQLFLTRPKQIDTIQLDQFLDQQFAINESHPRKYFQILSMNTKQKSEKQNIISKRSNQTFSDCTQNKNQQNRDTIIQENISKIIENPKKDDLIFFDVKNYQIVKNKQYLTFKIQNIQVWDEIQTLIQQIISFLKQYKVNSCKFKANSLLDYWSGKKLTTNQLQSLLKINVKDMASKGQIATQNIYKIYKAKKQMNSIIKKRQKQLGYIKWFRDRIKGKILIKKQKQYKINKAYQIHEQLLEGNYQWDIQIYISSFSQNQFVRNTTQYMENFENQFTHIWKQSSKPMILVIPTINSQILEIYQQKLKIKRSVTLICPQIHQLFPLKMSLAGYLLFSYQALNKIKNLILNKNAIIIPGKFQDPKYELLISQYLRTPLMTSLKPQRQFQFQKNIFANSKLSVLPYIRILAKSNFDIIVEDFTKLILTNRQVSTWIFKINGQFGGRGLASFQISQSKILKNIIGCTKESIKFLEEYLKKNLKLKLKINFSNSLFMLGDYLDRLAQKGGIIEEFKQNVQSCELGFFIQNKNLSSLVSSFKSYSVNYSNKTFLYQHIPNPKLSAIIPKLKNNLQMNNYLGYVSVNMIIHGKQVYGIQIKPYLNQLTSIQPFIKCIESKRQFKLNFANGPRGAQSMQNQIISASLRNQLLSIKKQQSMLKQSQEKQNKILKTEQSYIILNPTQRFSQQQSLRASYSSQFNYLFIPNVVLTDVPAIKKAQFLQTLVSQTVQHHKFNILNNNLHLYLSNGISLNLLFIGKDIKKIKKDSIQIIRFLSQKTSQMKIYCGKNQTRDVFQFGDIIKAITQIKVQ